MEPPGRMVAYLEIISARPRWTVRRLFAHHVGVFPSPTNRKSFVVICKRCQRDVPTGISEFPFQSTAVECCLCGERRQYRPSELFLGKVVRLDPESGERELTVVRWGLVPFWSKDDKAAFNTINAKAETVAKSPAYREPWKRRRCLAPADWFYEWKKIGEKTKQPYAVGTKDDDIFAFAGWWDTWKDKASGQELKTYTILTTDPNELLKHIHSRMPVIVARADYQRWMESGEPSHLPVDLLRPYPAEEMKA